MPPRRTGPRAARGRYRTGRTAIGFGPFYTVNSAFGLVVPRSYRRKGPRRFLKERWARIGVPLVIFALVVHLPVAYLFKSRPALGEFIGWLYEDGGRRR
jgi:glucans biosynthesis protein C